MLKNQKANTKVSIAVICLALLLGTATFIGIYSQFPLTNLIPPTTGDTVGVVGPMGPIGPIGPAGPTGATGPAGPAGADGADAKQPLGAYSYLIYVSDSEGKPNATGGYYSAQDGLTGNISWTSTNATTILNNAVAQTGIIQVGLGTFPINQINGASNTHIVGSGENTKIQLLGVPASAAFNYNACSNFSLSNLQIIGVTTAGTYDAIRLNGCSNFDLHNMKIVTFGTAKAGSTSLYGINVMDSNNGKIYENNIQDIEDSGIMLIGFGSSGATYNIEVYSNYIANAEAGVSLNFNAYDCHIHDNQIYNTEQIALVENHATYGAPYLCDYTDNDASTCTADGYQIGGSTTTYKAHDITISGGSIFNTPSSYAAIGVFQNSYNIKVEGVTFKQINGTAIDLGGGGYNVTNCQIQNNYVNDAYRFLYLDAATDTTITGNTVNSATIGIDLTGTTALQTTNNYISDNKIKATTGINIQNGNCTFTRIGANDVSQCTTPYVNLGASTVFLTAQTFITGGATTYTNNVRFLAINGLGTEVGTEENVNAPFTKAGYITNMQCVVSAAPTGTNTTISVIRINRESATVTTTITGDATTASDTSHFDAVAVGDLIGVMVTWSNGAVASNIRVSFDFIPK